MLIRNEKCHPPAVFVELTLRSLRKQGFSMDAASSRPLELSSDDFEAMAREAQATPGVSTLELDAAGQRLTIRPSADLADGLLNIPGIE